MASSDNISRVASLLREASDLLLNEEVSQPPARTPDSVRGQQPLNSNNRDILHSTLQRARNMVNNSSRNGLFRRMSNQERLRSTPTATSTSTKRKKECNKQEKAIEFALVKAIDDEDDEDDEKAFQEQTLKWDSVIADGIFTANEDHLEEHIRSKIRDALIKKFPLLADNDFEFVKVRQKKITKPELASGTKCDFKVIKKMAGQGILYVRMKPHRSFLLAPVEVEEDDDKSDVEITAVTRRKPYVNNNVSSNDIIASPEPLIEEDKTCDIVVVQKYEVPKSKVDIASIINCIKTDQLHNPVEILRVAAQKIVISRFCESSTGTMTEGITNFITVDRENVLQSTFEEFKYIKDFCLTFEVDFMGELAKDFGGPRLEWIELMNKKMKEKYFDHGLREQLNDEYYYVGVMVGVAMLQNGQMPKLFTEKHLDIIFCATNSTTKPPICIIEIQRGLQEFGLQDLFFEFPIMRHLLQHSDKTMTVKNIIQILQPMFSPEGSTAVARERSLYGIFIKYLREVASGRRNLTLGHVLKFVTGISEEPVLGFTPHPSIKFVPSDVCTTPKQDNDPQPEAKKKPLLKYTPTSHTCPNILYLPRGILLEDLPSEKFLFNLYDFAFSSDYFGII